MKTNIKKGFTLIELLIVIAIIGILAAVVLVSTTSGRNKAQISAGTQALKSVMPYATDCYLRGGNIVAGSSGGNVCSIGSYGVLYPTNLPNGCTWGNASGTAYSASCGGSTITCNVTSSACN